MTREELSALELEEAQEKLAQELTEYKAKLSTLSDEELEKEEQDLMERFKENDEHIKNVLYELPPEASMELTKGAPMVVKAKEIMQYIVGFLNTIESEWRTSLGVFQLIQRFKDHKNLKLTYGEMDSILRTLGTVIKYKGERDLTNIFIVNNWLSTAHEAYMNDTIYIQYLSTLHQAIMDAMKTDGAEE